MTAEGPSSGAGALKAAWRRLLPADLRRHAQPVVAHLAAARVRGVLSRARETFSPGPLIVSGLVAESKGVSEGARLTLAGVRAAGFDPHVHDVRQTLQLGPGGRGELPARDPGGVWILHVNAPEALHTLAYLDPAAWLGRRRIGYWAYELPRIPSSWARTASAFHEIWTPSMFVANAVRAAGVGVPVRVMPHPVTTGFSPSPPARARFGMPDDAFVVLAMGDLASSATRKNLEGAAAIYRAAFPDANGYSTLILKVQGDTSDARFQALASRVAAGRDDIRIIADTLPETGIRSLVASCDVLLSPHRAEGFGLALAEAFLSGVPALATEWSGNLDFMEGMRELLIASTLTPVRDASGVYRGAGLSWAEPDIADGARKLQLLAGDPSLRGRLAAAGRARVEALSQAWSRTSLEQSFAGLVAR